MTEVIVTRGIPGSGKSTWAKAWVAEDPANRVRVNRDDIRFATFGKYWGVDEDFVSKIEEATVRAAIKAGKDVVIDATHLKAAYVKKWARIHPVTVKTFEVDVETAVARDAARDRTVGENMIRQMASRFLNANGTFKHAVDLSDVTASGVTFKPAPPHSHLLPDAIIVDTDGTLANLDHRSPFAQEDRLYAKDGVYEEVAQVIRTLSESYYVIGVSGREDRFADVTKRWWQTKTFLNPDEFYMRKTGDTRKDDVVKSEIFDEHIAGRYNVIGVWDDRPRVLRMWREKGLTTFAVGPQDVDF